MRNLLRHSLAITLGIAALTFTVAAPAAATNGSITGTVKSAASGNPPVPNAQVMATTTDGLHSITTTANASGQYSISLPPGTYCVSYGTAHGPMKSSFNGKHNCLDGITPTVIAGGEIFLGGNTILQFGGAINGTIRDGSGTVVPNVSVTARAVGGNEFFAAPSLPSGGYTLSELPFGNYCLTVDGDWDLVDAASAFCPTHQHPLTVASTITGIGYDLAVTPNTHDFTGGIKGRITDALGGGPLFGRRVLALRGGVFVANSVTDSSGVYEITGLPPGQFCVEAQIFVTASPAGGAYPNRNSCDDDPTLVTVGTTIVNGIDIAEVAGGSISGQVTIPGGAGVPANLRITGIDDPNEFAFASADSSGNYTLQGLPAGRYCVQASRSPYPLRAYNGAASCEASANPTPVSVTRGATTSGINIALVSGGTISGTITVPAGDSLTTVETAVVRAGSQLVFSGDPVATPSGAYSFTHVPPASYCLVVTSLKSVRQFIGFVNGLCVNPPLVVTDGATTTRDVALQAGGSISGFVVHPDGSPSVLLDVSTDTNETSGGAGVLALPRADGSYVIPNVATGTYCVTNRPGETYLTVQVYNNALTCATGTRVAVTAGANTPNINFGLATGGTITGTLTTTPGNTFAGATIELHRLDADQPVLTQAISDSLLNGTFPKDYSFTAPPGTYCVLVNAPLASGSASRAYGDSPTCAGATSVVVTGNHVTEHVDINLPSRIFVPLPAPQRLVDTRPDGNTYDHVEQAGGAVAGGTFREVTVGGRAGVPIDAATAALNITAVGPLADGFLTVFPCGSDKPLASNLNYAKGGTVPNLVLARLGTAGKVCVFTNVTTDIIVDVAGYFPTTKGLTPLPTPLRLVDTRSDGNTVDGVEQRAGAVAGQSIREITVGGRAGVPTHGASVALNVTATNPVADGFLTVFPCGSDKPLASNLNFVKGETVANSVISRLGTGAKVCVFANVTSDIVVDVAGYFNTTDGLTPLAAPLRLVDTRADGNTVDTVEQRAGAVAGQTVREVTVGGRAGVPPGTTSVALNVTAAGGVASGFLTVFPCGSDRPLASNVNFTPGQSVPNSVLSRLGTGGKVCVFANVTTDLIVDVSGHFSG